MEKKNILKYSMTKIETALTFAFFLYGSKLLYEFSGCIEMREGDMFSQSEQNYNNVKAGADRNVVRSHFNDVLPWCSMTCWCFKSKSPLFPFPLA